MRKVVSLLTLVVFLCSQVVLPSVVNAGVFGLPPVGTSIVQSSAFMPVLMKGIKIYPENPFQLDFIVDPGQSGLESDELQDEGLKLIKYFLASLTTPSDEMWVNLSPYEKDRIIPEKFGETEMGRDLLAQDYILKQITASLMNPEKDLGNEFWKRIYEEAKQRYGTTDIPINTFNKVWIVPEKAVVYENRDVAFVSESHLKVMLDSDYVAMTKDNRQKTNDTFQDMEIQSQLIREIIIPAIEKEVNEGENFSNLRQIYNSMILATWYKRNLKESVLGKVYADQNKINGVDVGDKSISKKIYHQYLEAFEKGVFNFIKEEYDQETQQVIERKYYSGGIEIEEIEKVLVGKKISDRAMLNVSHPREGTELFTLSTGFDIHHKNGIKTAKQINAKDFAMLGEGQDIFQRILDDPDILNRQPHLANEDNFKIAFEQSLKDPGSNYVMNVGESFYDDGAYDGSKLIQYFLEANPDPEFATPSRFKCALERAGHYMDLVVVPALRVVDALLQANPSLASEDSLGAILKIIDKRLSQGKSETKNGKVVVKISERIVRRFKDSKKKDVFTAGNLKIILGVSDDKIQELCEKIVSLFIQGDEKVDAWVFTEDNLKEAIGKRNKTAIAHFLNANKNAFTEGALASLLELLVDVEYSYRSESIEFVLSVLPYFLEADPVEAMTFDNLKIVKGLFEYGSDDVHKAAAEIFSVFLKGNESLAKAANLRFLIEKAPEYEDAVLKMLPLFDVAGKRPFTPKNFEIAFELAQKEPGHSYNAGRTNYYDQGASVGSKIVQHFLKVNPNSKLANEGRLEVAFKQLGDYRDILHKSALRVVRAMIQANLSLASKGRLTVLLEKIGYYSLYLGGTSKGEIEVVRLAQEAVEVFLGLDNKKEVLDEAHLKLLVKIKGAETETQEYRKNMFSYFVEANPGAFTEGVLIEAINSRNLDAIPYFFQANKKLSFSKKALKGLVSLLTDVGYSERNENIEFVLKALPYFLEADPKKSMTSPNFRIVKDLFEHEDKEVHEAAIKMMSLFVKGNRVLATAKNLRFVLEKLEKHQKVIFEKALSAFLDAQKRNKKKAFDLDNWNFIFYQAKEGKGWALETLPVFLAADTSFASPTNYSEFTKSLDGSNSRLIATTIKQVPAFIKANPALATEGNLKALFEKLDVWNAERDFWDEQILVAVKKAVPCFAEANPDAFTSDNLKTILDLLGDGGAKKQEAALEIILHFFDANKEAFNEDNIRDLISKIETRYSDENASAEAVLKAMHYFVKAKQGVFTMGALNDLIISFKENTYAGDYVLKAISFFESENKKAFSEPNFRIVLKMLKSEESQIRKGALKMIPFFVRSHSKLVTSINLRKTLEVVKEKGDVHGAVAAFVEADKKNRMGAFDQDNFDFIMGVVQEGPELDSRFANGYNNAYRNAFDIIPLFLQADPGYATVPNMKIFTGYLDSSRDREIIAALKVIPAFVEADNNLATEDNLKLVLKKLGTYLASRRNFPGEIRWTVISILKAACAAVPSFAKANPKAFTFKNFEKILELLQGPPLHRLGALMVLSYFIESDSSFATAGLLQTVLEMLDEEQKGKVSADIVAAVIEALPGIFKADKQLAKDDRLAGIFINKIIQLWSDRNGQLEMETLDGLAKLVKEFPKMIVLNKVFQAFETEIDAYPQKEQSKLRDQITSSVRIYLNEFSDETNTPGILMELKEILLFVNIVHDNLPLVLDSFGNMEISGSKLSALRKELPLNNPLTKIITMFGFELNKGGYLDAVKAVIKSGNFDKLYELVLRIAKERQRRAPQYVSGILDILREEPNLSYWKGSDWDVFNARVQNYYSQVYSVLIPPFYRYYIENENDPEAINALREDVDRELGAKFAWGDFNGLSDGFMRKYSFSASDELALLGRYLVIANLTTRDFSYAAQELKKVINNRGKERVDEVDAGLRNLYSYQAKKITVSYQPGEKGEASRIHFHNKLSAWANVEYDAGELDRLMSKFIEQKEVSDKEKGQLVAFIFEEGKIQKDWYKSIPEDDGRVLSWLDRWGIVFNDHFNDRKVRILNLIENGLLNMLKKGEIDEVYATNDRPGIKRELQIVAGNIGQLANKFETDNVEDIAKLLALKQKVSDLVLKTFDSEIEEYEGERSRYEISEKSSSETHYVGFFDDLFHLMGESMGAGVCTWDVRNEQVKDERYHFGTLGMKTEAGNLLIAAQVQLLRASIKGLSEKKSEKGWQVLNVVANNVFKDKGTEEGKFKEFTSMLELAQRLADQLGMQGATFTASTDIHAQGNPEHRFVEELIEKGWLIKKTLSEKIFLARSMIGSHPEYIYEDVYLIQIPEEEFVLKESLLSEVLNGNGLEKNLSFELFPGAVSGDKDSAMMGDDVTVVQATRPDKLGGIDLNEELLDIQTRGAGMDFDIPVDLRGIDLQSMEGLSPVIFQIIPTNMPALLGISEQKEELESVAMLN